MIIRGAGEQLHTFLTAALHESEWPNSRPGRFTPSGVPRNFVRGGSKNSVEDRENGDLGVVAP